jgi:hypothetical protein
MRRREVTKMLRFAARYIRYAVSALAWVGFSLTPN